MNPWVVLNLEFELMSVAALRDEEYLQQAVNGYSDIQHCCTAGLRDPLLSSHRQSLHWIFPDYQELWMAKKFLKTWLKSCFLEPRCHRWRWRLSAQGSWSELHLIFFWGFDARNIRQFGSHSSSPHSEPSSHSVRIYFRSRTLKGSQHLSFNRSWSRDI
jgi:hypothetical protein